MQILNKPQSNYFFTIPPLTYYAIFILLLIADLSSIIFELSNGFIFPAVMNIAMIALSVICLLAVIQKKIQTNIGVLIEIILLVITSFIRLIEAYSRNDLFIHEIYTATFMYTISMFLVGMIISRLSSVFFFSLCVLIILFSVLISGSPNLQQEFILIGMSVFILLFTLLTYRNQMEDLVTQLKKSKENEHMVHQIEHHLRRETEDMLQQLQTTQKQVVMQAKLASLGTLTAGIAHEIKNPLNFVNNFSESSIELIDDVYALVNTILPKGENNNSTNPPVKELFKALNFLHQNMQDIHSHGKRADQIVKSMLLHARESDSIKSVENINDLIEECITLVYHSMRARHPDLHISIQKRFDKTIPESEVFRSELNRVFINLITNSIQSLVEKSQNTPNTYKPHLIITTASKRKTLIISIEDNGIGIANSIKEKILTPFFTTKPPGEGTGLGLSLSYEIIHELHNGTMTFESEYGEFARFCINLPLENNNIQSQKYRDTA